MKKLMIAFVTGLVGTVGLADGIWTVGAGSFSGEANWQDGVPASGSALFFNGPGGTVVNDLAGATFGNVTVGETAGSYTFVDLALAGSFTNASGNPQALTGLKTEGAFAPAIGGGLTLQDATAGGDFAPTGTGAAVTLTGSNSFNGNLVLQGNPLTVTPRVYKQSGWSKDADGNNNENVQMTYWLRGDGVNTFTGGLEDATGNQRGDVIILEGDYTFGGNVVPNGSDGYLVIRGKTRMASILADNNHGWNSRVLVENGGEVIVDGDVRQTAGNGFHLYLAGPLTVNGELKLSNANDSTLVALDGSPAAKVTAHALVLAAMKETVRMPLFVGTGDMVCTATKLGTTIAPATAAGAKIKGTAVVAEATTFRAETPDGAAADLLVTAVLSGSAPVTKTGAGRAMFAMADASAYTGDLTVDEGRFGYAGSVTVGARVTLSSRSTLVVPTGAEVTCNSLVWSEGARLEIEATPNGSGTLVAPNTTFPARLQVALTGDMPPAAGKKLVLIKGARLTNISLYTVEATGMRGNLALEDGDLVYNVTSSDYVQENLVWAGTPDAADWNLTAGNWKKDGVPSLFSDFANVLFDGSDAASTVTAAEGLTVGTMTFDTARAYTLQGARLLGGAPMVVKGGAQVTVDGGLDAQPITIENGTVRPGDSLIEDALGLGAAAVTVLDGGTFDLNVTTNTENRALMTHNKTFRISGDGFDGRGALGNFGPLGSTLGRVHGIELMADATLTAKSRWDMRQRNDGENVTRPYVTGPDATLTVKGFADGNANVCVIDADVKLRKLKLIEGGTISLEGSTEEIITEGCEIGNGHLYFWNHWAKPFTASIVAVDGNSRIGNGNQTVTVSGPVEIAAGATLTYQDGATATYTAEVSGDGEGKVTGGTHIFKNIAVPHFTVTGGWAVYDNVTATGDGSKNTTVTGNYLAFTPTGANIYSGYDIQGDGTFVPSRQGTGTLETRIENSTIDVGTISFGMKEQTGFATFGEGTTVTVKSIYLGDNGEGPEDATLTIATGATVTVVGGGGDAGGNILLGRWSGAANHRHRLVVDGGTLDVTAEAGAPRVGYDTRTAELLVKDGTARLPGVATRFHKQHNMVPMEATDYKAYVPYGYEVFGMSGGTVELSGDFTTERTYPYIPQIWLGGGTLTSQADWKTDFYQVATFETWGDSRDETKKTFTLDTNGHAVEFRSALQGNANVTITGDGSFTADYNVQGGLGGHWTIATAGTANLKNAAAFARGLTLAEGATATIDIGERTRYSSLAVSCNANGDASGNEFTWNNFWEKDSVFPNLFTKNVQKLITLTATPTYTAFRNEAEFYVDEAGTYTFCVTYDDRGDIVVDGTRVCFNESWNSVQSGQIALDVGWHRINVTCHDQGGGAGPTTNTEKSPDPQKWRQKGMAAGWHKGAITSTDPDDYQPIDSTTMKLRPVPSVRWNHRYTSDAVPDDWHSNDTYTFSMVTNSMQAIHNTDKADLNNGQGVWIWNDGSLNSWTFWTYVEAEDAGTWEFSGVFDDRLGVKIDGAIVFENVSWNNAKTATANVEAGWHKFKITTCDAGGGWSWSGVAGYGAGLYVKRPTDAAKVPFDERNVQMTADPYGFIGGEVELNAGSVLSNASDTACDMTGTLAGTGTLDGKYKLLGTWKIDVAAAQKNVETVKWSAPDENALAGAKLAVTLDEKPKFSCYYLGCAPLGLQNLSKDELQSRLACTLAGEPFEDLALAVKNNELVILNAKAAPLAIVFR